MSKIKLADLIQERRHRYPMEPKPEGYDNPEKWQFATYIGKEADLMGTTGKAAIMDDDNCAYLPEAELNKIKPEDWSDNAYHVSHKDLEYESHESLKESTADRLKQHEEYSKVLSEVEDLLTAINKKFQIIKRKTGRKTVTRGSIKDLNKIKSDLDDLFKLLNNFT